MMLADMVVDPEFRSLIPPLSPEEYNMLEENIISDGIVHDPIIVWAGHDIIVDGHNRFSILQDNPDIPFSVYEKEFACRDEVLSWICRNQIGRRNISDIQKTLLLGIAYEAQKRIDANARDRDSLGHYLPLQDGGKTTDKVAEEFRTSKSDVERSGRFVRGLNEIEKAYPGTTERIKRGDLEVTKKDVMAITKMDEDEKQSAMSNIVDGKRIKPVAPTPESTPYDVNDFRSELHRKVDTLDKSLELTCILTHKDILETEEGKAALQDTLLEMAEVLKKYSDMC